MTGLYKTLIIGSGAIGASIAYHLSNYNERVLVVDQGFPTEGTSGATQAWVWVHTKQPNFYGEFSMYSAELYQSLKKRLGMEFELDRTGGLSLIFEKSRLKEVESLIAAQQERGIKVELLTRQETLRKEPEVNPNIVGATYSALDGHLNPFRLTRSLIEDATNNGMEFSFYNKVVAVKRNNEMIYEVETEKGTFLAEQVVIAGGPWSKMIGQMLNVNIPIKLVKGQIIVTEPLKPLLNHIVSGVRQTNNGELLIGYSKEEDGFNRNTSFNIVGETARYAQKIVPKLKKVNIVRTFAGIRSMPKDGLPILGEVPSNPGLYVAVTHSGITLAPIVGLLMSELLREGSTSFPLDDYLVSRFKSENELLREDLQ
ncbi:NAD(P)/FAD-dependent oxidoreductase [Alkalihalobacterium elongatum]|uniref:NAD(P)/FAD-dependent oxidoreductase n=1 Tax=Alkalihalobacterium elongatum TaxID=2675466 RepID=UPI001C1FC157|nr:FAD-dependent oxidoreductase [Alkalihalobacterium elongatum]